MARPRMLARPMPCVYSQQVPVLVSLPPKSRRPRDGFEQSELLTATFRPGGGI